MLNNEIINKAVLSSDFVNGGELNPKQREVFLQKVREFSVLIPLSRFIEMDNPRLDIPKMHLGDPITRGQVENVDPGETNKPVQNEIKMDTEELISQIYVTRRSLRRNVSQEKLLEQITDIMMKRISTDLEELHINGDTNLAGGTKINDLLNVNDGLDKLTDAAHILDHGGGFVSKQLFATMMRTMPVNLIDDPDMRFMLNKSIEIDWMDLNSQRIDGVGERAFGGAVEAPFGVPIAMIPRIRGDKNLNLLEATSAQVIGTTGGAVKIETGVNDAFNVDIDNGGVDNIVFNAGVFEVRELAQQINVSVGVNVASDDGFGRLVITSPTTGASSEVDLQASNSFATLGFTVGTTNGSDAGVLGGVPNGTHIWLARPENFMWGALDQTEIHTKFRQEKTRWETVVINETDTQVEDLDGVVKAINVRRKLA